MYFFSALSVHAPNVHLVVRGELDAFAAMQIRGRLEETVDHGCIHITVDASAVHFVDAAGLDVFVRLRKVVAPFGGSVRFTAVSERFREVAQLAGLTDALDLYLLPRDPTPGRFRGPGRNRAS